MIHLAGYKATGGASHGLFNLAVILGGDQHLDCF